MVSIAKAIKKVEMINTAVRKLDKKKEGLMKMLGIISLEDKLTALGFHVIEIGSGDFNKSDVYEPVADCKLLLVKQSSSDVALVISRNIPASNSGLLKLLDEEVKIPCSCCLFPVYFVNQRKIMEVIIKKCDEYGIKKLIVNNPEKSGFKFKSIVLLNVSDEKNMEPFSLCAI